MVQLIALGLVGGLAWYAYRALQGHMDKIGDELDKKRKDTARDPKTGDVLEKGPDGVYRPVRIDREPGGDK